MRESHEVITRAVLVTVANCPSNTIDFAVLLA